MPKKKTSSNTGPAEAAVAELIMGSLDLYRGEMLDVIMTAFGSELPDDVKQEVSLQASNAMIKVREKALAQVLRLYKS